MNMFEIFDIKSINSKDSSYFKDKLIIRYTFDSTSEESIAQHDPSFSYNTEHFDFYFTNTNSLVSINKNIKYKDAYDFLNNEANIDLLKYLFLNKFDSNGNGWNLTINDIFNKGRYLSCYINSIKELSVSKIIYHEIGQASLNKGHKIYNLLKKIVMVK